MFTKIVYLLLHIYSFCNTQKLIVDIYISCIPITCIRVGLRLNTPQNEFYTLNARVYTVLFIQFKHFHAASIEFETLITCACSTAVLSLFSRVSTLHYKAVCGSKASRICSRTNWFFFSITAVQKQW